MSKCTRIPIFGGVNLHFKRNEMSKCTRKPIFGGVNLHFKRNEIKCSNVQESQFLVKTIYILRKIKSNVQMYKNPNFLVESIYILGEMKSNVQMYKNPNFFGGVNLHFRRNQYWVTIS